MNIYADTMPIHIYFKVPTSFKIKFVRESFVTLVTQISLASMNPHVVYMTGISLESLVTLAALIWFLHSVPYHMAYKSTIL